MNDLLALYLCLGAAAALSAIIRLLYLCKIKSPKNKVFIDGVWKIVADADLPDAAASLALTVIVFGYLFVCVVAWPYVLYGIIKRKKA